MKLEELVGIPKEQLEEELEKLNRKIREEIERRRRKEAVTKAAARKDAVILV